MLMVPRLMRQGRHVRLFPITRTNSIMMLLEEMIIKLRAMIRVVE